MSKIDQLMRQIESARKKHIASDESSFKATLTLENIVENPDKIQTNAENADNLLDAVMCYIQYGEYSIEELREEIEVAIEKRKLQ